MTPATARSAGGTGIERLNPPELFDLSGLGFSSVVIAPGDRRLVYIAGKLADGSDSDFEQQVRGSFDLLDQVLRAGGASMATVLKITCLMVDADADRIASVTAARLESFGDHRPVSTIIPVPRLVGEHALFEIESIAVALQ